MKILMINSVCGIRSTGRICTDIAESLSKDGNEVKIGYGRGVVPEKFQKYAVKIGNTLDVYMHALLSRLTDKHGFYSKRDTKKFLRFAEEFDPDVLWLHNLHGYYINIEMLFDWIKSRPNMKVKWTLHDCWAFTGHCTYFVVANCYKWETCCYKCEQKARYPKSVLLDRSKQNFERKKSAFLGVNDMTLITPSKWLKGLVERSFLKEYPIEVQYNTIDTSVFKPTESDFRKKYGLEDKKIVLGVSSEWNYRKGLEDFIELYKLLDDDYKIVLVGVTKSQERKMPKNILCIEHTNSVTELAEIYTAADVFVNASREETFGLTTVEAKSCGTPVIVYKGTACEEIVGNGMGGVVVDVDLTQLKNAIINVVDKSV